MNKPLGLFLLFFCGNFVLSFITSCNKAKCGGNPGSYCLLLDSMAFDAKRSAYAKPVLEPNATAAPGDLVLVATFYGEETVCMSKPVSDPFVTTAYACSPATPRYSLKDRITEVTITSDKDYNATHPAGSSLNEYFEMSDLAELNAHSLLNYTTQYELTQHTAALRQGPEKEGTYTFMISFKMASGKELLGQSVPLQVKN